MTGPNLARIRARLREQEFADLFVEELGWDHPAAKQVAVEVDGIDYEYEVVAQKRGVIVCVANWPSGIPDQRKRSRLERALARAHLEHVVVYLGSDGSQAWVWARR